MDEIENANLSPQQPQRSHVNAPSASVIAAAALARPSTLAPSAVDLEAIRASVNDAATVSGGLWLSYLFVMFYLTVGAGAVTHVDLFLEKPVKLPFLGIDLPLLAFFCLAPMLFLIVHAYTLVHFVILAEKAKLFHQALSYSDISARSADGPPGSWRETPDNLRRQLPSNVFVQFLAGPPELRAGAFGWTLRAISWISLAIAPILLLLLIQVQFLAYQSAAITWLHRAAIVIDFVLLWWLWRKILTSRHAEINPGFLARGVASVLSFSAGVAFSLLLIVSSVFIITFDDEWQERYVSNLRIFPNRNDASHPLSIHDFIFQSTINEISRKRIFPFSNTLILTNVNLFDALGVDGADKIKSRDFLYRARGRRLRGAIFDHAIMPKIDFFGAHLEGASFVEVQLDQSSFDQAFMDRANVVRAVARGTSFEEAELNGASFAGSNLEGADFAKASLLGASLANTDLSGAKFIGAKMIGADLGSSAMFGASFNCAELESASFGNSSVSGSFFVSSHMDNANFNGANIDTSDFSNARLSQTLGAGGKIAGLYFENLSGGNFLGNPGLWDKFQQARIDDAPFQARELSLFKEKICRLNFGNIYILNSEVFSKLGGPGIPQFIDYILGPDCAISASLSSGERDDLRARRQTASADLYRTKFLQCPTPSP